MCVSNTYTCVRMFPVYFLRILHNLVFSRIYVPTPTHTHIRTDTQTPTGWEDNVERETVHLCRGSSYRRCLLGMAWQDADVVVGRDLEPQVGMPVKYYF